jgi:predicted esterase
VSDKPPSDNILGGFIKERVHELADSLIGLFSESDIPKNSVVLTGWSLGCVFAMELLAQDPPSRLPGVNLQSYIRAVNFYGLFSFINTL